jgi:ketosteroid isomerase-like protein
MAELDLTSPDAAEQAFYRAFETTDLALMGALWLDCDSVSVRCIHPGSDLITGYGAVLASWRGILSGAERPTLRYQVLDRQHTADLALHLVEEQIGPQGADAETGLNRILATNVYRKTDAGWRMVLHHASLPLTPPRSKATQPRGPARLH